MLNNYLALLQKESVLNKQGLDPFKEALSKQLDRLLSLFSSTETSNNPFAPLAGLYYNKQPSHNDHRHLPRLHEVHQVGAALF